MALSKGRQGIVDAAGETQVFLPVGEVYHLLVIIQLDTIEARAYKAVLKQDRIGQTCRPNVDAGLGSHVHCPPLTPRIGFH